ncbi:MAG: SMP-30/gluconolactonase/LRE family protein [Rectinemataceae bacterium]|jgi:sugar lactone lactonase YvrE
MSAKPSFERVLAVGNEIGEAPIWVPEESRLYWVDTEGKRAFSYRPADGESKSYELSMPATALLRRRGGGWVAVTKEGLAFWDQASGAFEPIVDPVAGEPDLCFNDGAVDRSGRIVAGTMNFREHRRKDGRVFRLETDLSLSTLDEGLSVANGIGFSPKGETMYVSEQFAGRILAYDYDAAAGRASGKRVFAEVSAAEGLPDGIVVDAEGFVWNGRWGGSTIARYAPDGSLDRKYDLPVETGTCMAFGGDELRDLYVTTAWYGMDEAAKRAKPGSGDLFRIRPGVVGTVEPRFAG